MIFPENPSPTDPIRHRPTQGDPLGRRQTVGPSSAGECAESQSCSSSMGAGHEPYQHILRLFRQLEKGFCGGQLGPAGLRPLL